MQLSDKTSIEDIISKIISYRDDNNIHLLTKYSIQYLTSLIEKDKIAQLEKAFKEHDKKGVDIIDFVRIFLNILEHQPFETIYLIMSLVEFFRIISENLNMVSHLKFQDITNYICDAYVENSMDDYILKTKKLPESKKFNAGNQGIREIDILAPPIYGISEENLKRLVQSRLVTDSSHHNNQSIKMGHYAKEIKKVFTLDSLSDRIHMYNLDCILEKSLQQKRLKEKKDVIILSFAWSNRQQRVGATLKDFSLIFWDSHDNFEFEKRFFISNFSNEYQTNIWFIDYMNLWLTTDRSNVINSWDIEKETLVFQLSHPSIKNTIIDIIEIPIMKLVATGSLDRLLCVWDLTKKAVILIIDLKIGGIHSVLYFETYQVLITAGYENSISVYQINPVFLDHDLIGKLIGHNSMVTAIQCIDKTPILVSADDNGILKLWDIRSFKCVQTVDVGSKTIITKILDIGNMGKICFLGSRVNFLDFDDENNEKKEVQENLYPIKAEYNYLQDELVICTRKDLRFLDLESGRIKKIYKGLLRKSDDEITIFKSVEQNKKFIIGDHRGGLMMFLYNTGEKCGNLQGHVNEITTLKVDFTNKLFISGGWDSTILIQKEEKNDFEVKREIKNCFNNKEINLLDVSVYHNLIVTISNNKSIYIWDYEYCKLLGSIDLDEGIEPTNICFINGYSILCISATNCKVFIVKFEMKEQNIEFKLLGSINLEKTDKNSKDSDEEEVIATPKIQDSPRSSVPSAELRASMRASYFMKNARKSLIIEEKTLTLSLHQEDETTEEFKEKIEKKISNTANKMIIDLEYSRESEEPKSCFMCIGLLRGAVRIYDIFKIFTEYKLEIIPHANKRMNYNAYRGAKEDFLIAVKKVKAEGYNLCQHQGKTLKFSNKLIANFQAHKEQLTTLSVINLSDKRILTSSIDSFIKVWSFKGEKLAAVNINHPLPIIWDLQLDKIKRTRKNILFALKIVELIFRRYKRSIMLAEEKNINVNNFLSYLSNNSKISKLPNIDLNEKGKNPLLLKQEYSPRDLHYDSIKHIFQREIMGPSLKEMEANKQIQIAQKIWKSELDSSEDNAKFFARDYLTKKYEEKAYKERDAMLFFDIDFREKLINTKNYDDYLESVQKLSKKLETSIKRKKIQINEKKPIVKPGKNQEKNKKIVLPPINNAENNDISKNSEKNSFRRNRSKTHDSSSLLNKMNFLEYASVKNLLLDSTALSNNKGVSQSQTLNVNNVNNTNNQININDSETYEKNKVSSSQIYEKKGYFKNILKNLDMRLKKSQIIQPKLDLPKRGSELINLLDESASFIKPKTPAIMTKLNKKKSPVKRNLKNAKFVDNEDNSVLNSNESQHEIDHMLAEILQTVQEKVRRKLETELMLRKKEWEIETKRKIMKEFSEQERIVKEKEEIEKKIVIEKGSNGNDMGFESLGKVFLNVNRF